MDFYEDLYRSENTDEYRPLDVLIGKATVFKQDLQDIVAEEVAEVIIMLPSKSTPGEDGTPNKFYKRAMTDFSAPSKWYDGRREDSK